MIAGGHPHLSMYFLCLSSLTVYLHLHPFTVPLLITGSSEHVACGDAMLFDSLELRFSIGGGPAVDPRPPPGPPQFDGDSDSNEYAEVSGNGTVQP